VGSKDSLSKKPRSIFAAKVPPALISRGLKADEWVSTVTSNFGGIGKGAKTGEIAQGHVPNPDDIENVIEKAKEYPNKFLRQ